MKIACVYHSIDLDGWMSGAIVKYWNKLETNKNDITFIGYNYGQPIPDLSNYEKVIMCDISFPKEVMSQLNNDLCLCWIDHHISAIKDNEDLLKNETTSPLGIRNTKKAACQLTWEYFFPNTTIPEIVRLLGAYDCFSHKGTDEELKVLQFQYGARQVISSYEEAYKWLVASMQNGEGEVELGIHAEGATIYTYVCKDAKQSYKNGFEIELIENIGNDNGTRKPLVGRKFICFNKERFNPINFNLDYHADGYDGAACYHYANGKWNFSLYNDNGKVNCSVIAKSYSGGGHAGASGFVCNDETMLKLINNK